MIVVAKTDLKWQEVGEYELRDLNYDWSEGEDGPFLEEDIEDCCDLEGDGMVEDVEELYRLGARGSVIFVDTCADRPFIKAVLSEGGVSWFTANDISSELREVRVSEL